MILADTSVWVTHFRSQIPHLVDLLERSEVGVHSFVIGELACGTLHDRRETLAALRAIPSLTRATDDEVLLLIERHGLMGRGIGLVDVHLLASTLLTPEARLWTQDRRLAETAGRLGIGYAPPSGAGPHDALR